MKDTMDHQEEKAGDEPCPVLPLRDVVVFPGMVMPLFVGRKKSVAALDEAIRREGPVFLATQKDAQEDDPGPDGVCQTGVKARVMQFLRLPDGTVKVLVEGGQRARILCYTAKRAFAEVVLEPFPGVPLEKTPENVALLRSLLHLFGQYMKLGRRPGAEVMELLNQQMDEPERLADMIAAHLGVGTADKQALLEMPSVEQRLKTLVTLTENEIAVSRIEKKVQGRVRRQVEKTQREYYLNEQMKAIQKELGEGEEQRDELTRLEQAIRKTRLSKEAHEKAVSELRKLRHMSPMAAETTVVRNYLETLLALPWMKKSRVRKDMGAAERVLDQEHYGLGKVKERILEHLAVQNRVGKVKGPILCLVGPPGVGKTSLGQSVARATGRPFVRMALGGVRDEAEIRGHRRTYIGALPGKIIQGIRKAGVSNPLFLLDEIDKMGQDWRGDPASALLEVLDPEQNKAFSDHYMEVDFDLSDVMFVTTANTLNMPQPLLDRMEVIRLSGYTEEEKIEIARRHLVPRLMSEHGLKKSEWSVDDKALKSVVQFWTREAGVRQLERELAKLCRKAVRRMAGESGASAGGKAGRIVVTAESLPDWLGVQKYHHGEAESQDLVGVTTGLAWTEVGGELLSIEAVSLPGKGTMKITGKLGEVMQESVQAAASYVRSRAQALGMDPKSFDTCDLHIHVPEGGIPKDGPSAGVAMCTSIVSVMTGIPVRRDVAMTGEITLRGRVLPIGGLKEKLLAAHRGHIKRVLIPADNRKDLAEIPENARKDLEILCVQSMDEVLAAALAGPLVPWSASPSA